MEYSWGKIATIIVLFMTCRKAGSLFSNLTKVATVHLSSPAFLIFQLSLKGGHITFTGYYLVCVRPLSPNKP